MTSVIVSHDMELTAFVKSSRVPDSIYKHLLSSGRVDSTSGLINVLALCKSMCMEDRSSQNSYYHVELAVLNLKDYVSAENVMQETGVTNSELIAFIIEQLTLLHTKKLGRRYSTKLIMTAFLWKLTSTALYKKLKKMFFLPSINYLTKLCANLNVEPKRLDLSYLAERTSTLTQQERIVTLMIDEIYTASRIEYSNGSFIGLTDEGLPAKTVLAFMVQSIKSKYKDVVCLVPISKLDTATLRSWFDRVMISIDEFLLVSAISVDNHVCNRWDTCSMVH